MKRTQAISKIQKRKNNELPWWYHIIAVLSQGLTWLPWERLIRTLYNLRVTGKDNLQKAAKLRQRYKRGVLFAAKHTGELDIMLVLTGITPFSTLFPMFYVTQDPSYYKSKDFGWRRFFYGKWSFYFYGAHPLRGYDGCGKYEVLNNYDKYPIVLRTHEEMLKRNCSVCVFPEGKIPENGETLEMNGGVGYFAKKRAVIVPVAIKREKGRWRTKIRLHYCDPLHYEQDIFPIEKTSNSDGEFYRKISDLLKERIEKQLRLL